MKRLFAIALLLFSCAVSAQNIVNPYRYATVSGCGTPPSFPSTTSGFTDTFTGTGNDLLATYNSTRYGAITGVNSAGIHGGGTYAADTLGNSYVGNKILTAPTSTCFDISIKHAANSNAVGGVFFNMTTNDRTTGDGYWIGFYHDGARRAKLWKIVNGAFDTELDTTGVIDFLSGDGAGVRWFGDGTWQMYYSDSGGAWTTTGTPGTDTTYLSAGEFWLALAWNAAYLPVDDLTVGAW